MIKFLAILLFLLSVVTRINAQRTFEKQFLKSRSKAFVKSEDDAINSVVTAVQEKLDDLDKSLNKDAELDANNRGQIKHGIPPKYHTQNLPVYDGTILR